jgi:hypothetical protein
MLRLAPSEWGDHQGVARTQEAKQQLQLVAAVAASAARLLGTDRVAAGGLQRSARHAQILVDGSA